QRQTLTRSENTRGVEVCYSCFRRIFNRVDGPHPVSWTESDGREFCWHSGLYTESFLMAISALTRRTLLFDALCSALLCAQEITPEQKQRIDAALPQKAPARPKQPRRMLVTNLSMRDGKPVHGSSYSTLPAANYAIGQMGSRTGAYEAVFTDDIEMFRPERIKQFDALCFNNTLGVLFEDAS